MKIYHNLLISLLLLPVTAWSEEQPPPDTQMPPVDPEKVLFIRDKDVIGSSLAKKGGAWHFRSALQRIAGDNPDGTPVDVDQFAVKWFDTWATNDHIEEVEGQEKVEDTFAKRPWVAEALKKAWAEDRIRLIAIVNRLDLTKFPDNDASQPPLRLGEGRFIYEIMKDGTTSEPFTIIFEYRLPGDTTFESLKQWAKDWQQLDRFPSFDETYRTELKNLTDQFSKHGTLNQIRTNEFLDVPQGQKHEWELREFHFDATRRIIKQGAVAVTPAIEFDGSDKLKDFIRDNLAGIIAGKHEAVPAKLGGAVSPVATPSFSWKTFQSADSAELQRAGFIVSFNTCSGCHAGDTGTLFQHIGRNAPDLSPFLKGEITLAQKLPGQPNTAHDEMKIRAQMLRDFMNDPSTFDDPVLKGNIKSRANRVH